MGLNRLFHTVIRVPKEESAFAYFQLEANEGLAFYSTLKESLGQGYRDIDLKGDLALRGEIEHLIQQLQKKFSVEILVSEEIDDQ